MAVLHRHVVRCSRIVSQLSSGVSVRLANGTACCMARFPTPLIGNHSRIRPADIHPEHAPDRPGNQAWRFPCQLVCRRFLPGADDDDGEHDQDEPHGSDGEDQYGGHRRSTPLLIVRSMKRGRKIRGAVRDVAAGPAGRGVGTRPAGSGDAGACPQWLRGRPAGQRGCEAGRVSGRGLPVLAPRPTRDRLGDRGAAGSERQGRCLGPGGSPAPEAHRRL